MLRKSIPLILAIFFFSSLYILPTQNKPSPPAKISPEQGVVGVLNHLKEVPEGIRVENRRHQALFTSEGITFTPRKGPILVWKLNSIGDQLKASPVKPLRASINQVNYHRGEIIERYVIKSKTIEQQFIIEAPPRELGQDFWITGRVETNGKLETSDRGWLWRDQNGVVSLGRVTVIDAKGNLLPASMEVEDDQTRIRVAGLALAHANYPVTIDPELGTNDFRISDMGPDGDIDFQGLDAAVAYNSTNNEYLVVWTGDDAAPPLGNDEFEVYGQRIDAANGAEIGSDFRISDMGPDGSTAYEAEEVAIAYNSTDNEYLVVWRGEEDFAPLGNGEREIFGQRIDANPTSFGEIAPNNFRISNMGPDTDMGPDLAINFDAIEPAVAYNPTENEYLVVWEGDDNTPPLVNDKDEIFGQRIDGATGGENGVQFRISHTPGIFNFNGSRPAVAFNSAENEYLVVWQGENDDGTMLQDEYEIYGQLIDGNTGAEMGGDFRISDMGSTDGDNTLEARLPDVAYNSADNEYLVVWEGEDDTPPLSGDGEFEIFGQRINGATGVPIGTNDFRISDMGPDSDPSSVNFAALNAGVSYNPLNNEYLVVWDGDDNTPPLVENENEIFGQRLRADTGAELGGDFRISDAGPNGTTSLFATRPAVAYGATQNEYLIVWEASENFGPPDFAEIEIFGQRFAEAVCGNGFLDAAAGEPCDDGNGIDDDGCRNNCMLPTCSDGVVQAGEECDDGNSIDNDGCRNNCSLSFCGDAMVQSGEQCDNGAGNSDTSPNACRTGCLNASCGDGVQDSGEGCDDGDAVSGDGCSNVCQTEGASVAAGGCSVSSLVMKTGGAYLMTSFILLPVLLVFRHRLRKSGIAIGERNRHW